MYKLYNAPVQVELNAQKRPRRLQWYNRWYIVISCFVQEDDQHWLNRIRNSVPPQYRYETEEGMVCDLYFSDPPGVWILERIFD